MGSQLACLCALPNLRPHALQPGWCEWVAAQASTTEDELESTGLKMLCRWRNRTGFMVKCRTWMVVSEGKVNERPATGMCGLWL